MSYAWFLCITHSHTHTHMMYKRYYFFKLGRSLLTQRRRQDFPVRCKRPLDRMELQSLGPYFLTWLIKTSSSSAFHGPFFISPISSYTHLLPSINKFTHALTLILVLLGFQILISILITGKSKFSGFFFFFSCLQFFVCSKCDELFRKVTVRGGYYHCMPSK